MENGNWKERNRKSKEEMGKYLSSNTDFKQYGIHVQIQEVGRY
jgi:hypothetical protein